MVLKNCLFCGNRYETTSYKSKYCSQNCNQKAWRERNPEQANISQRKQNERRKEERKQGIKRYNSEVKKNWYKRKKEDSEWVNKIREQEKQRHDKVQSFIRRYKLLKGCTDCGYKEHHAALDFDHIGDDKLINVAVAKSIRQAKEEIRKCEVVCSNCHRIRTYTRLHEDD